jgi:hypothetical protein
MAPEATGTPASNDNGLEEGMTSTPNTTDKAQATASAAADEGRHVAGVAKDEAQNVASQAKEQARGVMDDAMSQVHEQSRTQRDRLVGTLQTFSDDLEQMASQGGRSGMATDVARQVADKTRSLSSHIDGREPSELLDEVRDFARRRPGTFLLGALAAGVVAGRFARGAKEAKSSSGSAGSSTSYDGPRGTATGAPLAGTGYPAGEPAYPDSTATGGTGYPTTGGTGAMPTETRTMADPVTGLEPGGTPQQRPMDGGPGL